MPDELALQNDIHSFIEKGDYLTAIKVLRNGMSAQKPFKGPGGIIELVPDHNSRIRSAQLLLAYGFGAPTTRNEVTVTHNDPSSLPLSPSDLLAKISASGMDIKAILNQYVDNLPIANDTQRIS
jgi:hypothetical protein